MNSWKFVQLLVMIIHTTLVLSLSYAVFVLSVDNYYHTLLNLLGSPITP